MDDTTKVVSQLTREQREALFAAEKLAAKLAMEVAAALSHAMTVLDTLRSADDAIRAVGGKPESSVWDDWDIVDLLRMGDAARHVKEAYGATLTIEPPATRRKPGPKEDWTPEELMQLALDVERMNIKEGWSQQKYTEHKYVSRYRVQQAVKYCADNPDIFRQFQAKTLLR